MNTINFKSRATTACVIAALTLLLAFISACAGTPPTPTPAPVLPTATPSATAQGAPPTATPVPPTATPTVTPTPVTLKEMAEQAARGVGKVMKVVGDDPKKVIFVFEDDHRSPLAQVNAAIMLNRLYARYRLRHIGLEGFTADKGTANLAWAHRAPYYQPGQNITGREDVIVQTLRDGEISGAELMGLIYADVVVHGVENAELYAYEQTQRSKGALSAYLARIALARMNNEQRAAYQALVDQKKGADASLYAIRTDKFTADIWERQTGERSAEEGIEMLERVEQEAAKAGVKPTANEQAAFQELRQFAQTISLRSDAMAANMLKVTAANPGTPLALVGLGLDHTQRVVELLTKGGASVVVIRPSTGGRQLSDEQWIRKNRALSVAPAGTLGRILSGGRKPPPVFNTEWYKNFVQMMQYANEMARGTARASDQSGGDWKEMAKFLADVAAKWADQFGTTNIAFDGSTFPPQVQMTIVLPNGQTVNFNSQMTPGTYNPNDPDGVPDWDLYAALNYAADDLNTHTYTDPKPGDPQQTSSNTQARFTGPGVPPPQQPALWNLTPEMDGVWKIDANGNKVTIYFDGRIVTEFKEHPADALRLTEYPGGKMVMEFKNGDIVTEDPENGTRVVYNAKDGSTETYYGKTGVREIKYKDGKTVTYTGDFTTVTYDPKEGTTVTEYKFGQKTTYNPKEGTLAVYDPDLGKTVTYNCKDAISCTYDPSLDGKVVIKYEGGKTVAYNVRTGSTETYDPKEGTRVTVTPGPDGTTKVTEYSDWTKVYEFPGGKTVTEKPGESLLYNYPDNTKATVTSGGVVVIKPDGSQSPGYLARGISSWDEIARELGVSEDALRAANPHIGKTEFPGDDGNDVLIIPPKPGEHDPQPSGGEWGN